MDVRLLVRLFRALVGVNQERLDHLCVKRRETSRNVTKRLGAEENSRGGGQPRNESGERGERGERDERDEHGESRECSECRECRECRECCRTQAHTGHARQLATGPPPPDPCPRQGSPIASGACRDRR